MRKPMHRNDFISGCIWLAFFVLLLVLTLTLLPERVQTYPKAVSVAGIALSVLLLIQHAGKIKAEKNAGTATKKTEAGDVKKVLLLAGCTLAYVCLINVVGFLVTSIVYMFAIAHFTARKRNIKVAIAIAIIIPVILYLVFVVAFKVALPTGFLL